MIRDTKRFWDASCVANVTLLQFKLYGTNVCSTDTNPSNSQKNNMSKMILIVQKFSSGKQFSLCFFQYPLKNKTALNHPPNRNQVQRSENVCFSCMLVGDDIV